MFGIYKDDTVGIAPIERLPATASEAYVYGEALKITAGKATKASGTDAPSYICAGKVDADSGDVPAIRVAKSQVFKTELSAAGTALNIGDKVTLATDGLRVTATTTSGVAEIVGFDGKASGDTVYVRF